MVGGDVQLNAGSELYRKVVQLTSYSWHARSFIFGKGDGFGLHKDLMGDPTENSEWQSSVIPQDHF
jgi:hypothetical protein